MPSPIIAEPAPDGNSFSAQIRSYFLRFERLLSSIVFWWFVCLLWAGIFAWLNRHSMNPDGMSYLDMASNVLSGGTKNLVNGYWSPAYPALISLALLVFRPSPTFEFPLIHLVNFLVFVLVLLSFTFFLNSWIAVHQTTPCKEEKSCLIPFSFGLFLWFTLSFISVHAVTPDLSVAAVVFLAAGTCCRISLPGATWKWFVALGIVLGIGYYTKAAMFPLGLILLALLFVYPPPGHFNRLKVILSGIVFVLVAAPLATLISSRVGHLSFGETGRLNYAWFVNGLQAQVGWTGGARDSHGSPEHSPRILLDNPRILEFASPVNGTYPLWYEPSYWYAGVRVHFDFKEQLEALKRNLRVYWQAAVETSGLMVGAFVFCILTVRKRMLLSLVDRSCFWLLLWPVSACLMYAVVHVETRFVGAFFVIFWLAVYGVFCRCVTGAARSAILAAVLCTLFVPTAASLLSAGAKTVRGLCCSDQPDHIVAAAALSAAGVQRGGRVASVGRTFDAYYARCAGVRVVAEIRDKHAFERLTSPDLARVKDSLAAIGVNALVFKDRPVTGVSDGWIEVSLSGTHRFSILLLNDSARVRK